MEEEQKKLLDLADAFIRNEVTMGIYYQVCAERIPEFKDKWLLLSIQEHEHADIFRRIKSSIQENPWKWSAGKYSTQAVNFASAETIQKIAEIKAGQLVKEYIVSFVTDMESSAIEMDIRTAFHSELKEFDALLARLAREGAAHRQTLLEINANLNAKS